MEIIVEIKMVARAKAALWAVVKTCKRLAGDEEWGYNWKVESMGLVPNILLRQDERDNFRTMRGE